MSTYFQKNSPCITRVVDKFCIFVKTSRKSQHLIIFAKIAGNVYAKNFVLFERKFRENSKTNILVYALLLIRVRIVLN
jgi:hypothetical protein